MKKFINSIVKFAVIFYAAILFFSIGFAVLLIIAPKLLLKIASFVLLAPCVIAVIYLLAGMIGMLSVCNKTKRNSIKMNGSIIIWNEK